jgi:hypothetical protein
MVHRSGLYACALGPVPGGRAQEGDLAEARRLNGQVLQHYVTGQYLQAIPIAQRALAITEKALGPEHADSATALNNLALWLCLLRKRLGSRAQAKLMPSRPPQKFADVVGAPKRK